MQMMHFDRTKRAFVPTGDSRSPSPTKSAVASLGSKMAAKLGLKGRVTVPQILNALDSKIAEPVRDPEAALYARTFEDATPEVSAASARALTEDEIAAKIWPVSRG